MITLNYLWIKKIHKATLYLFNVYRHTKGFECCYNKNDNTGELISKI